MKKNIDASNMREVILKSPDQLIDGLTLAKKIKVHGDFSNIIICGIGGSALPADLLNTVAKVTIPIYIHRNYHLSQKVNAHSLVVCISYSGNTEETISALQEGISKKLKIICIEADNLS